MPIVSSRLPAELDAWLAERAKRNRRTKSAEILVILEEVKETEERARQMADDLKVFIGDR